MSRLGNQTIDSTYTHEPHTTNANHTLATYLGIQVFDLYALHDDEVPPPTPAHPHTRENAAAEMDV